MSRAKMGHPISRELIQKMIDGRKGKPNHMLGKHLSPEAKARLAAANLGKRMPEAVKAKIRASSLRGPESPHWKGGISFAPYGPGFTAEIKRQVRERDGHRCRICGELENGRKHDCHHIDYDKGNNQAENIVTLCNHCHSLTNRNRESWVAFFAEGVA